VCSEERSWPSWADIGLWEDGRPGTTAAIVLRGNGCESSSDGRIPIILFSENTGALVPASDGRGA